MVSVVLKINSYTVPNLKDGVWAEVLRFTTTENNCCNVGDRILAIFTNNNDKKVYVKMDINNQGNVVVLEHSFAENTEYRIGLTQRYNYNDKKVTFISNQTNDISTIYLYHRHNQTTLQKNLHLNQKGS